MGRRTAEAVSVDQYGNRLTVTYEYNPLTMAGWRNEHGEPEFFQESERLVRGLAAALYSANRDDFQEAASETCERPEGWAAVAK